jgi:hypothetical protein
LCCVNSASSTCTRRQLAIRTRGVSPFLRLRVHPVCVSQAEPGLARPHPHPWGTRSARHGKGQVPAPAAPSEGWAWPAPAAAGPGRPAVTTQRPACAHEGERASSTPARSSGRASRRSPTCAISCHWMRGRPVRNTQATRPACRQSSFPLNEKLADRANQQRTCHRSAEDHPLWPCEVTTLPRMKHPLSTAAKSDESTP